MRVAPRRKRRGGQHRYSDLAIETALTLAWIGHFTADDACDGKPAGDTVINHSADAAIVICRVPRRSNRSMINLPAKGISISRQSAEAAE